MRFTDTIWDKIVLLFASLLLAAIIFLAFFLDTSLGWNAGKIVFCVIACFWAFFTIPSYKYIYFRSKDLSFESGVMLGIILGIDFLIIFPILLAPYCGIRYYLCKTENVKN